MYEKSSFLSSFLYIFLRVQIFLEVIKALPCSGFTSALDYYSAYVQTLLFLFYFIFVTWEKETGFWFQFLLSLISK